MHELRKNAMIWIVTPVMLHNSRRYAYRRTENNENRYPNAPMIQLFRCYQAFFDHDRKLGAHPEDS